MVCGWNTASQFPLILLILCQLNISPGIIDCIWHECYTTLRFAHQIQSFTWTDGDTQTTSDASTWIKTHVITIFFESIHLTAIQTVPTSVTQCGVKLSIKRARHKSGRLPKTFKAGKYEATTATATTNSCGIFWIGRLQYQVRCIRFGKDIHDFFLVDKSSPTTLNIVVRPLTKN